MRLLKIIDENRNRFTFNVGLISGIYLNMTDSLETAVLTIKIYGDSHVYHYHFNGDQEALMVLDSITEFILEPKINAMTLSLKKEDMHTPPAGHVIVETDQF